MVFVSPSSPSHEFTSHWRKSEWCTFAGSPQEKVAWPSSISDSGYKSLSKHRHGATSGVDVYYYGIRKVHSQLYNDNNPFLNYVANTYLRHDSPSAVDCTIGEEPWN